MGLSIDLSTMEGLTRLITSVERHPVRTFVAIGLLFALLYTTTHVFFPRAHGRVINGDAIQQYVYLQSVAIDGDLDFGNEYQAFFGADDAAAGNVWLTTTTPVGRSPNMMPVGPALLWAPAFLLVWLVAWLTRLVGGGIPLDGLAAPFQISVGIAGIAYATAGVCLCHDLARRIYPATAAFWATLTLWLASSVVYYSLVSPAYSHAVSLFAVALFCHAWFRTRDRDGVGRFVLLGALGGLAALMRWQDAIVLILPGAELARESLHRAPGGARHPRPGAGRRRRVRCDAGPAVRGVAGDLRTSTRHAARGRLHGMDPAGRARGAPVTATRPLHLDPGGAPGRRRSQLGRAA